MPIDVWLSIGAAIAFTLGGIFMQWSDGLSRLFPSLCIYVLFLIGASFQTLAVKHSSMGSTYILVLGLEVLLAITFSVLILKEDP